jgi:hypothetical protein
MNLGVLAILAVQPASKTEFDAASYIIDNRATVEPGQQVAGVMARRAARIAHGRAGGKQCRA